MKLVLLADDWLSWSGGTDFLRVCAGALAADRRRQHEILFAASQSTLRQHADRVRELAGFCGPETGFISYPASRDELALIARAAGAAAVLLSLRTLGDDFPLPWAGAINDFQPYYFPQYWPEPYRRHRALNHEGRVLFDAPAALCLSAAVQSDAKKFYPGHHARLTVWPAGPLPIPDQLLTEIPAAPGDDWSAGRDYVMIANQLWPHKDFATALRALHQLRQQGHDLLLVCTGSTANPHCPGYFSLLQELVAELRLTDAVRFTGHIPKPAQLGLLRRARVLLQPSRFEGVPGGQAALEALAFGVPVILTDLPVNRELTTPGLTWFQPGAPDELAAKITEVLATVPASRPDPEAIRKQSIARQQQIADVLHQLIELIMPAGGPVNQTSVIVPAELTSTPLAEQQYQVRRRQLRGECLVSAVTPENIATRAGQFPGVVCRTARPGASLPPLNLESAAPAEPVLLVYTGRNTGSAAYRALQDQATPVDRIVHGTIDGFDFHDSGAALLCLVDDEHCWQPHHLDLLRLAAAGHDAAVCGLRRTGRDGRPFHTDFYPVRRGRRGSEDFGHHCGCVLYRISSFVRNGKWSGSGLSARSVNIVPAVLAEVPLDTFLRERLADVGGKPLFIYGTGEHTRQLLANVDFSGYDLRGLVGDPQPGGETRFGLPVYSVTELDPQQLGGLLLSTLLAPELLFAKLRGLLPEDKLIRIHYAT